MRGISAPAGAGCEDRVTEEDRGAQSDESSYKMFWPQNCTVWDLFDLFGDRDQVVPHFSFINLLVDFYPNFGHSLHWAVSLTIIMSYKIQIISALLQQHCNVPAI